MEKKWKVIGALGVILVVGLCCATALQTAGLNRRLKQQGEKLDKLLEQTAAGEEEGQEKILGSLKLTVNGMNVTINLDNGGSSYNCPTLNTEFDTVIQIGQQGTHEIYAGNQEMTEGSVRVRPEVLKKDEFIQLSIDGQNYFLRTLPEDFPEIIAQGESPTGGFYYTTLDNYVIKLDSRGQVVFYRKANAKNAGPFRRNIIDGEVIYSYLETVGSSKHAVLAKVGYSQTRLVLLDEQYNKIEDIPYLCQTEKVPEEYPLENHEYQILGKDHYILTTYLGKRVTNIPAELGVGSFGANVVACIIQEVRSGQCVFEWDSTDHPALYGLSREAGDYTNSTRMWSDYAHVNAVTVDPSDGNLVCSIRNFDSIIKISRQTGEILWMLGGEGDSFGLTQEQQFRRQHHVTVLEDGSYLLFDNGCTVNVLGYPVQTEEELQAAGQQETRMLRFFLDEENMQILDWKEYRHEGYFSATMGSVQVVDDGSDTLLVGWGGRSREGMPLFEESNFRDKKVYLEVQCADGSMNCYRVTKYEN